MELLEVWKYWAKVYKKTKKGKKNLSFYTQLCFFMYFCNQL